MVLKLIREAAEYITEYEPVFLYLYGKQHELHKANNFKAAKQELEKSKQRIVALDKLIQVAFEKNVLGTLRDDLFERMTANYEQEQRELMQSVAELEHRLANAEQDNIDLRAFLSIIRKCTDLQELTPELVNRLITKIEVLPAPRMKMAKSMFRLKFTSSVWAFLRSPIRRQLLMQKKKSARIRLKWRKKKYGVALIGYTVSYLPNCP